MAEFENVRGVPLHDPDHRYDIVPVDGERLPEDPLDSEESQKRLQKLNDWWHETRVSASENRTEQAIDDDFIDGIQWSDEDAAELRERNQQPLVFNEIKPSVEWVIGTEKRTRIDWAVLPRGDEDRKTAEIKTQLLKYISDVNKAPFARSRAFASAVGVGIGWLEIGIKGDSEDEPIFIRSESWRNMWWDHLSVEPDLSDARYVVRSKVLDCDIAVAMFPKREHAIKNAAEDAAKLPLHTEDDFFDSQLYYNDNFSPVVRVDDALGVTHSRREVVRLIECWYRVPETVKICRCQDMELNGREYKDDDDEVVQAVKEGFATIYDAVRMRIRVAVFIEGTSIMLQDMPSPYRHNRFPFVPVWGYRRGRDNMPYGITRNQRDPQQDLNKRRSKALFLLSVNRTIMDKGAVDDLDEYQEEVSRPDAIIEKNIGKHLEIETNVQLAEEHMMLAQDDRETIRNASGVTGENLGHETNATSGRAISARQNQGTIVTAGLFDNLRLAVQLSGEIMLSLIEQFYTDEKVFRITGDRGVHEFAAINQYSPETGEYLNDITQSQADFVVSEQDYRESIRMAMFEQLMEMIGQMDSSVALNLLDLVFEFSDFAGKDEMVKRIRELNGQADPNDADAQAGREAAAQQQQQQAAEAEMLALREAAAKVRSLEAKAEKDESSSDQARMSAVVQALQAAVSMLQAPQAAVVAQDLIEKQAASNPTPLN